MTCVLTRARENNSDDSPGPEQPTSTIHIGDDDGADPPPAGGEDEDAVLPQESALPLDRLLPSREALRSEEGTPTPCPTNTAGLK